MIETLRFKYVVIFIQATSKRVIQKTAEVDLIGNKFADQITKVSKNSQENTSETVTNKNNKEISRERYLPLEKRQEIIGNLRLI